MGIPPDAIGARIVVYSHEPGKRSTVDATVSNFFGNFVPSPRVVFGET
jgi:hypothetical protein